MSGSAFYKIPPEIWEKVILQVGRRDLAAIALTSRETYPVANPLLYRMLEVSFCKCSQSYYDALARTIINNSELAALITNLFIDMKVSCRVKTVTSVDNFHSAKSWKSQYRSRLNFLPGRADDGRSRGPKGQADWNREAVQTLLNPQFFDILHRLSNLERITVIIGHFQQDSEVLSSLLKRLPENVLPSLQVLKVYDASLVTTPSLRMVSGLRVLDLGYVAVDNSELCTVVSQNAGTLEEVRLHWIMEPRQRLLFSDYSGTAIKGLKAFTSQGPHAFSFDGLKKLLCEALWLEDLRLESLSFSSAVLWGQILITLTEDGNWKAGRMRVLKFGAATGCGEFWDSAVQFLRHCGNGLISLCINGSPRGPTGPFPPSLLDYFLDYPQPVLTSLVLIWRDDAGLFPESAGALPSFAPSLEMLHTCLPFPLGSIDSLLSMIAPFTELRRVHLTFLKHARLIGADTGTTVIQHAIIYTEAIKRACEDIVQKGPTFQGFVRRAAISHPVLSEVSWSIYDRVTYSAEGPKAYVKINRSSPIPLNSSGLEGESGDNPSLTLEDLGEECRKYESMESLRFRCPVGTKKVLLNQRPGWREEMGNPYLKSHRVCQYAEFNTGGDEHLRRMEL